MKKIALMCVCLLGMLLPQVGLTAVASKVKLDGCMQQCARHLSECVFERCTPHDSACRTACYNENDKCIGRCPTPAHK